MVLPAEYNGRKEPCPKRDVNNNNFSIKIARDDRSISWKIHYLVFNFGELCVRERIRMSIIHPHVAHISSDQKDSAV